MSLRFRGGERLQRGRGIGGLLRLAKGLLKPVVKSAKEAITSNTAKAIGKAVANQLVESGANIATDALMGNDVNESVYRELKNTKQNAAAGIQILKRGLQCKKNSSGFKNFRVKLNVNSNQDPYKKKKKISGYSYVQEFSIRKKDYSRFRDLCISKFLNDNVKEHNELIEKVQKYFKQVHCKEMAFELMNKIIEEYEMKYERNEVNRTNHEVADAGED